MTTLNPPSDRASGGVESLLWRETLADGTAVTIRAIRKEDAALEREFIGRLSDEARRMRFLGQIKEPSDALIRQLTDLDFDQEMALIAIVDEDGKELEVGVSRYAKTAEHNHGECAVTVADDWQRRGLGSLLMRRLIEVARARGMTRLFSTDVPDNVKMKQLAEDLGFSRHFDASNPREVVHSLDLA